jgi:hypothetical protein
MMDDSRQPHQMLQHQLYKRTWREPPNPISSHRAFKLLWKKQRLAEMRAAILRGDWPRPVAADGADSSSDAEGWDGGSDSDAGSPSRQHRQSGEHSRQQQQHMQQDSEEDLELEQELQEAAAAQLDILMERVRQQHEEQLQAARAAAEEVEAEHTATTNQVAEIQARLDDLREKKHELFQQLKLVSSVAHALCMLAAPSWRCSLLMLMSSAYSSLHSSTTTVSAQREQHALFHAQALQHVLM